MYVIIYHIRLFTWHKQRDWSKKNNWRWKSDKTNAHHLFSYLPLFTNIPLWCTLYTHTHFLSVVLCAVKWTELSPSSAKCKVIFFAGVADFYRAAHQQWGNNEQLTLHPLFPCGLSPAHEEQEKNQVKISKFSIFSFVQPDRQLWHRNKAWWSVGVEFPNLDEPFGI